MTDHINRIRDGFNTMWYLFWALVVLTAIGAFVWYIVIPAISSMIGWSGQNPDLIMTGIIGCSAIVVLAYILGYVVDDGGAI